MMLLPTDRCDFLFGMVPCHRLLQACGIFSNQTLPLVPLSHPYLWSKGRGAGHLCDASSTSRSLLRALLHSH